MKSKAIIASVLSVAVSMSLITACTQGGQDSSKEGNKTASSTLAEQSTQPE